MRRRVRYFINIGKDYDDNLLLHPSVYLVQTHKRFLGIGYWKTLVKTTSYKIAKDAYDSMVYDGKIGF